MSCDLSFEFRNPILGCVQLMRKRLLFSSTTRALLPGAVQDCKTTIDWKLAFPPGQLIKSIVQERESRRQVRLEPIPIGDSRACLRPPLAESELKNGLLDM
jgi:hypothetical protein